MEVQITIDIIILVGIMTNFKFKTPPMSIVEFAKQFPMTPEQSKLWIKLFHDEVKEGEVRFDLSPRGAGRMTQMLMYTKLVAMESPEPVNIYTHEEGLKSLLNVAESMNLEILHTKSIVPSKDNMYYCLPSDMKKVSGVAIGQGEKSKEKNAESLWNIIYSSVDDNLGIEIRRETEKVENLSELKDEYGNFCGWKYKIPKKENEK